MCNAVATQWVMPMIRYKRFTLGDCWFVGNYLKHPIEIIQKIMHTLGAGGSNRWGWSATNPGNSSTIWRAKRKVYCLQQTQQFDWIKAWLNWTFEGSKNRSLQETKIYRTLLSKCCVPFKFSDPCHLTRSLESFLRIVVLTVVALSDGSSEPRSNARMRSEVAHTQVLFHVKDRCLRIQNAHLKNLVASQILFTRRYSW